MTRTEIEPSRKSCSRMKKTLGNPRPNITVNVIRAQFFPLAIAAVKANSTAMVAKTIHSGPGVGTSMIFSTPKASDAAISQAARLTCHGVADVMNELSVESASSA